MTEVNAWKAIPGYEGKYEAGWDGQIRRLYSKADPKVMSQYEKSGTRGSRKLYVKLTINGKSKEVNVAQCIYQAFKGKIPKGRVVVHKNGLFTDNAVPNLEAITMIELGLRTGANSSRKPVAKIDTSGEIVDVYSSAREAGRKNFMSYQTVIDRCNGLVKKSIAPDGFDYAWEDSEVSIKHALDRIRRNNEDS